MPTATRGVSALIAMLFGIGVLCLCSGLAAKVGLRTLTTASSIVQQQTAIPTVVPPTLPASASPTIQRPAPTTQPSLPPATTVAQPTAAPAATATTPPPPPPPTATPVAPSPTPTPKQVTYVVKSGDTLSGIARRFGVSVDALAKTNHIANLDQIQIGQTLIIPPH